jgi:hypothetical protein
MASSRNRYFDLVACLWHRPFSGFGTTRLCSAEDHRGHLLDQGHAVRYAKEHDKRGFFSNVTTVLPPSGLVVDHTGAFSGSGNLPATGHRSKYPRDGKTAA